MIKAIFFDMVGVLVFKKAAYIPRSRDEIHADQIENLFNHIDDVALRASIHETLHLTDEEIKKAIALIPEKYEKCDELWQLLPVLQKKYIVGIINNGNALTLPYWNKRFDFSMFYFFISSAEIHIKKPDPKIYLVACKKARVQPEECLFMDDSPENIDAAKKLGMQTIWWNPETDKKDLVLRLKNLCGLF